MEVEKIPLWFIVVWVVPVLLVSPRTPCAYFQFPTLSGEVLTATDHDTIKLPFNIIYNTTCSPEWNSLQVTKITNAGIVKCSVPHEERKCQDSVHESKCRCLSNIGEYMFSYTVDRSDGYPAYWLWSTENDAVQQKRLYFNVLYPAKVKSLTTAAGITSPVDQNSTVDVVCIWENGNPLVTARLLDRHGVEMEGSIYSSGQIRYRFPAVGCQDAGLIRCEAPGASHNETAMLLVKCPPELSLTGVLTSLRQKSFLHMRVRAHTTIIQDCELKKSDRKRHSSPYDDAEAEGQKCPKDISLRGSPPDMTLEFPLDVLGGVKWRLELTNDVGTGYLDLNSNLSSSDEEGDSQENPTDIVRSVTESLTKETTAGVQVSFRTTTWRSTTTDSVLSGTSSQGFTHLTYIAAIIAVVLIVGIISLTVGLTVVHVKKGTRHVEVPAAAVVQMEEEAIVFEVRDDEFDEDSGAGSEKSTNTYEEIPDGSAPQRMEPPRPARRHCQAPPVDPDDYLHPVPTPSDAKAAASSENVKSCD